MSITDTRRYDQQSPAAARTTDEVASLTDPLSLHLNAYVAGNPINNVDSSGRSHCAAGSTIATGSGLFAGPALALGELGRSVDSRRRHVCRGRYGDYVRP